MSMTDAEIREALARAERATGGECIVRNRYSHGGGRMYREDGPARDLILDVYDEANREFYFSARTDVPRLAADLLAARAERDEAVSKLRTCTTCDGTGKMDVVVGVLPPDEREVLALELCGECHGTGVSSWGQALAGAEAAERERDLALSLRNTATNVLADVVAHRDSLAARCRELEGGLRGVLPMLPYCNGWCVEVKDKDRWCETCRTRALLSPPPPHTCQIHRATSGASDCGLSPCEEAKVHTDRGASRPAENATPEDAKCATCGHEERRHLSEDGDGARWCDVALCDCVDYAALEVNRG